VADSVAQPLRRPLGQYTHTGGSMINIYSTFLYIYINFIYIGTLIDHD
jgi:hypothetical protein